MSPDVSRSKKSKPKRAKAGPSFDRRSLLPLLLIAAGIAAYFNSFSGAFLFDDHRHILDNARIRQVWPPWEAMSGRRPVLDLTFALNHAVGRFEVWGYHAVNLAIHITAALTLFGLIRRTLLGKRFRDRIGSAAPWLALATALIWLVHPLQTQSVTYIVQRGEALMGMFYLLTLYCVVRRGSSSHSRWWTVAAVIACALGMGSKAVMVTAPVMVLLYDRLFLTKSWGDLIRRRWVLHLGIAATWAVPALSGVLTGVLQAAEARGATVGFAFKGFTPLDYAMTQFGVIVEYLRLSVWPHPLCLDYGWPIARTAAQIVPYAVLVAALVGGTVWALIRRSWLGFAGAWFFLILSPTSSLIPIRDPLFEHRMYLPLAAVVLVVVVVAHVFLTLLLRRLALSASRQRWVTAVLVVSVSGLLGYGTARRNLDYRSELVMWQDVVAKRPDHPRALNALGSTLDGLGRSDEAIPYFLQAVALLPNYPDAYYNLGTAWLNLNKIDDALGAFEEALRLNPSHVLARLNLAGALGNSGRLDQAANECRKALKIAPDDYRVHFTLGNVLSKQRRRAEAVEAYRDAIAVNPGFALAHYHLGQSLRRLGKLDEAIAAFRATLELEPRHAGARQALESALAQRPGG
ncbi:MAG: tetratricopeptide repeat protein [Planctomycetes bacterium]|nr:tetratricopeptide repeat protein [Planctomycetota bacterium]